MQGPARPAGQCSGMGGAEQGLHFRRHLAGQTNNPAHGGSPAAAGTDCASVSMPSPSTVEIQAAGHGDNGTLNNRRIVGIC